VNRVGGEEEEEDAGELGRGPHGVGLVVCMEGERTRGRVRPLATINEIDLSPATSRILEIPRKG